MDIATATLIANAGVAVFTGVLALATFRLVKEAKDSRVEQERQRKEIAFRAALMEVADYITSLNKWTPAFGRPQRIWWEDPLKFSRLTGLLESVWIHPKLWERLSRGTLIRIKELEGYLKDCISRPAEDYTKIQNEVVRNCDNLDLYLKQLARYIFCEMRRQKLNAPEDVWNTATFQPRPGVYGDLLLSPETAAKLFESQHIPPLQPELDDAAFHDCRLQILIGEARQALGAQPPLQLGK